MTCMHCAGSCRGRRPRRPAGGCPLAGAYGMRPYGVAGVLCGQASFGRKPSRRRTPVCVEKAAGWRYNILRPEQAGRGENQDDKQKTHFPACRRAGACRPDRGGCDHCGGGLFLSGAEPRLGQQYLGPWHRAGKLCAAAAVGHHDDSECCAAHHRLFDLRAGVRRQDRLHQHPAAALSRPAGAAFPRHRLTDRQSGAGCAVLHSGGQRGAEHPVQPQRLVRRAGHRGQDPEQIPAY